MTKRKWSIQVTDKLSHYIAVESCGKYLIEMSTNAKNARLTDPVLFEAPGIDAPFSVNVIPEANGSFFLYWNDDPLTAKGPLGYQYEVLVQEGNDLDENNAQKFTVDHSPFVYTNNSASMYTFAIRIKTRHGFTSKLSEKLSKVSLAQVQESSVNLPAIIVPSLLMFVSLVAVIAFLVIRNRRLHSSFIRFSNSHYNSRSGAATFDDNGLEEEESPRIVGFSDDEPLVVA